MNNVCAEFPKMKENPRTIDARGTSEVTVSFLLKINRQMKTSARRATATSTASNFATALPTSW